MNNIEAERGRHNLSKEAISRKLGVTSKTYRGYIGGSDIPSNILLEMSSLFNCSVDYLLGLTELRTITDRQAEALSLPTSTKPRRKEDNP